MSVLKINNSALSQLQNWYSSQCDEGWEYSYGVKIDTLDNPGWMLIIDLADTQLCGSSVQREIIERTEKGLGSVRDCERSVRCLRGAHNLEEMIEAFLSFAESNGVSGV